MDLVALDLRIEVVLNQLDVLRTIDLPGLPEIHLIKSQLSADSVFILFDNLRL